MSRIAKKNNAAVIDSLRNVGNIVRITHQRTWRPLMTDKGLKFRVDNRGGSCIVSIKTPDGESFAGFYENCQFKQYNKNFSVHVALQRALKAMNKAHAILDDEEDSFTIKFSPEQTAILEDMLKDAVYKT